MKENFGQNDKKQKKKETVKICQGNTHNDEKRETPVTCKVWMSNLEHPQVVMGQLIIIPLKITLKNVINN